MAKRMWLALAVLSSFCGPARAEGDAAVWLQPFGLAASGVAWEVGGVGLYLLLGAQKALSRRRSAAIELSPYYFRYASTSQSCAEVAGCRLSLSGFSGSLGAIFHVTGSSATSGFFVQPKVLFAVAREGGILPLPGKPYDDECLFALGTAFGLGAGVDVGYQWRFQRLFVAAFIGGSVEQDFDAPGLPLISAPALLFLYPTIQRGNQAFGFVNFNLLRIGVAL